MLPAITFRVEAKSPGGSESAWVRTMFELEKSQVYNWNKIKDLFYFVL
jgi:hypothetical protein